MAGKSESFQELDDSANKRKPEIEVSDSSTIKKPKPNNIENGCEHEPNSSSAKDVNSSINSFTIEAAAAEDKGSRHTMEDACVVLPHADSNNSANLRFLSSFRSFFPFALNILKYD